jgi:hypothetical protein
MEAERQARRVDVIAPLSILSKAIADINEDDLASESVDAVITDPPYAEADPALWTGSPSLQCECLGLADGASP